MLELYNIMNVKSQNTIFFKNYPKALVMPPNSVS